MSSQNIAERYSGIPVVYEWQGATMKWVDKPYLNEQNILQIQSKRKHKCALMSW